MKYILRSSIKFGRTILQEKHYTTITTTATAQTTTVQSSIKPKICVVGAGPAGFYTSQYLLKNLPESQIDIIEKLPVPYGLVRFGVAPDHPEVKNVINTFTKVGVNPRVRYFGNLTLGTDFSLKELRTKYHAVVLSYGAEIDRQLNIPNEMELPNILSAREFVAWYNGLPGFQNLNPNLNVNDVTLIGQGNVAIDVARILLSSVDELRKTDCTEYALEQLANSKVKCVQMCGRRGPLQAAFTIKELREMLKLPNVKTVWRPDDFHDIDENLLSKLPRPRRRLTELMLQYLKNNSSSSSSSSKQIIKEFHPIFFRSPKSITMTNVHDDDDDNNDQHNAKLELQLTINEVVGNSAISTNDTETVKTDLILRSIGYQSINVDNYNLNFDHKNGHVYNLFGRVLKKTLSGSDNTIDDIEDKFENGLYVTGWLATGPTGVILTTMNNSFSTGDNICKDFQMNKVLMREQKPGLDSSKYPQAVSWNEWIKIDKYEMEMGARFGKPREKIIDINKMIEIAKS